MNGKIEAAQEWLEQAAFKWQKSTRFRGKLDRALTPVEKELDQAITRLKEVTDEYLKEKGSIPR